MSGGAPPPPLPPRRKGWRGCPSKNRSHPHPLFLSLLFRTPEFFPRRGGRGGRAVKRGWARRRGVCPPPSPPGGGGTRRRLLLLLPPSVEGVSAYAVGSSARTRRLPTYLPACLPAHGHQVRWADVFRVVCTRARAPRGGGGGRAKRREERGRDEKDAGGWRRERCAGGGGARGRGCGGKKGVFARQPCAAAVSLSLSLGE